MTDEQIVVEQCDREAAANLDAWGRRSHLFLSGELDETRAVQLFARHRLAALAKAREDALEEAAKVAFDAHHAAGMGWTPFAITAEIYSLMGKQSAQQKEPVE